VRPILFHKGTGAPPHLSLMGSQCSKTTQVNSLSVTTTSLLLELVTQRAGRWIWGSSMTPGPGVKEPATALLAEVD
jgi:hypothetical protein